MAGCQRTFVGSSPSAFSRPSGHRAPSPCGGGLLCGSDVGRARAEDSAWARPGLATPGMQENPGFSPAPLVGLGNSPRAMDLGRWCEASSRPTAGRLYCRCFESWRASWGGSREGPPPAAGRRDVSSRERSDALRMRGVGVGVGLVRAKPLDFRLKVRHGARNQSPF